ncbi:hypothetical protein J2S58_003800 [Nakamurella flavida]|nr:hypothetical protein [Nakamurella flavida]
MEAVLWIVLLVLVVGGAAYYLQARRKAATRSLDDARAEARRWVERLGGQVYALDPGADAAARQALADASERFTAAGSQVEQATTEQQYRLAQQTAYEGLYYVRAARTSLGLDPGPDLPAMPGQQQAGAVTEDRSVSVEGREYEASPRAGDSTQHYYPGGMVAGRPVPRGWYSEPWWKPALVAGAWGVGTYLVASSLFAGMAGMGAPGVAAGTTRATSRAWPTVDRGTTVRVRAAMPVGTRAGSTRAGSTRAAAAGVVVTSAVVTSAAAVTSVVASTSEPTAARSAQRPGGPAGRPVPGARNDRSAVVSRSFRRQRARVGPMLPTGMPSRRPISS